MNMHLPPITHIAKLLILSGLVQVSVQFIVSNGLLEASAKPGQRARQRGASNDGPTTNQKRLGKEDLLHGKKQVVLMLHDRPEMAKYVTIGDPVWNWTVDQFAGTGICERIYWGRCSSGHSRSSTNHYSPNWRKCSIRVGKTDENGVLMNGETQWMLAVGELLNIRHGPEFSEILSNVVFVKFRQPPLSL